MDNPPALETQPLSVKDWVITLIIQSIPLVNIIMLIVWATGAETHPSKKNYAKAVLIIFAVIIVLSIIFAIIATVLGVALGSHSPSQ